MRRTVQDVMTRDVVAVPRSTPFKQLARLLNQHRVTALPVVDDAGRVVGVVSESDLALKEVRPLRDGRIPIFETVRHRDERAKADGMTAGDVMTSPAVTAGAEAPVGTAARLMHDRRVKRLPVVDRGGALIGIVTRADLLKVFLRPDDELRVEILDSVAGELLRLPGKGLDVEVADGVVRLGGKVPRRSQALALARLVEGIDGVVAVDNRLAWDSDDTLAPYLPSEPLPLL